MKSEADDNRKSLERIHTFMQDVGVWLITGVCSFLAYNVWQMSISIERLVVQFQYVASRDKDYKEQFLDIANEIQVIRTEQLNRTRDVYDIAAIERRVARNEDDLKSRTNIRWNLPDQQRWIEETKRKNPDWDPAAALISKE